MDSATATPAPYGRSCDVCTKAKCKCILREGLDRCERCHRLNKDCRQPASKRRRIGTQKSSATTQEQPVDARTARLEEKLDQVLASLKPRQDPITPSSNSDGSTLGYNAATECANKHVSGARLLWNAAKPDFPQEIGPPAFALARAARVWQLAHVSVSEAEDSVADFREHYAQWFPAIYIPPNMSAEQLRHDRPFLWLNIVLAASHSTAKHQHLGDIVRGELAQAMVIDSEKSLDLLLGLLVFMGWYHRNCQCPDGSVKLSLSLLSQMAISLVFDLQLNRRELKLPMPHQVLGVTTQKYGIIYPRDREAKRAAISVFLITSMLSLYLQRTDPLRWTPYFADILKELRIKPEWSGDLILSHQVEMQLVVERAKSVNLYDVGLSTSETPKLPASAFLQLFQAQLDEVKNSFSGDKQANVIVRLHWLHNTTNIHDLAPVVAREDDNSSSIARTKRRWSALAAATQWLDAFFTIPPTQEYAGFAFSMTTHIIHCLGALIDLATLEEPGWDKELVRAEVDVLALLDRIHDNFAHAAPYLSTGTSENTFALFCKFFAAARVSLVKKLGGGGSGEPPPNEDDMTTDNNGLLGPGLFDLDFFDNEVFWSSGLWTQQNPF